MRLALRFEAACALLAARVATRTVRFITIARAMGWTEGTAQLGLKGNDLKRAAAVGDAIAAANRLFRFREACLAEAIAGKWMLARRGVATTLYVGMRIRGSAAMAPRSEITAHIGMHAWLTAGTKTITGASEQPHKTVASFY